MRKLFFIAAIFALVTLTGCGVSSHMTRNANITQTNVDLSQKNFTVVGEAQGEFNATYILGVGGLSKKALTENAHAEMLKNANLNGSQAVVNASITIKRYGVMPFYWKYKVISTAKIIEFTK